MYTCSLVILIQGGLLLSFLSELTVTHSDILLGTFPVCNKKQKWNIHDFTMSEIFNLTFYYRYLLDRKYFPTENIQSSNFKLSGIIIVILLTRNVPDKLYYIIEMSGTK